MANQKATLKVWDVAKRMARDVRVTLVDSDGGAATFTDFAANSLITVPAGGWQVLDLQGYGTTAPATALVFQPEVDGINVQGFAVGAAVYDPTSRPEQRVGALHGLLLRGGSSLRILGRA